MDATLSLYKLVDTLGLPVTITTEKGKLKARGEKKLSVRTELGIEIPFKLEVRKGFQGEQIGIVAHVLGNLYIIAGHYPKTGGLSVYLIDGDKLTLDGVKAPPEMYIKSTMGLREVLEVLRGAVVQAYFWKTNEWKILKLPN